MGRERIWLLPLMVLLFALFLASCLPNPAFDGRAAARRYVSRLRRISAIAMWRGIALWHVGD